MLRVEVKYLVDNLSLSFEIVLRISTITITVKRIILAQKYGPIKTQQSQGQLPLRTIFLTKLSILNFFIF